MTARGTLGTPRRRAAFLKAIAAGRSVEEAAELIQAGRRTVYSWRASLPGFANEWDEARDACADKLEAVLTDIALGGDVEALKFLLRARLPKVYNRALVSRLEMLELAKAKARAEAINVPTIEGQAEARPVIYPVQARLELPKLLRGKEPAPMVEIDDAEEGEEDAA
jgi:hypothetical protein